MSAPENFLSRWTRLKRESDTQHGNDLTGEESKLDALAPPEVETTAAQHRSGDLVEQPFDLASLPSVEAITVDTDIRGFLQAGVPPELTRAALRQAWASDAAIRDFIGIAENQWDFNDPNAIFGFGPLSAEDNLGALLMQATGSLDRLTELIPETPVSVERPSAAIDSRPADLDQDVQQTFDGLPDDSGNEDVVADSNDVSQNDVSQEDGSPQNRRSHGGALPR